MTNLLDKLDWQKMDGLLPVVVQDEKTNHILMLGYMNQDALLQTLATKRVTFYSRSKEALWIKGETSGNYLHFCDIFSDCDGDSLLIKARPQGPTCHQGTISCFKSDAPEDIFSNLEKTIESRYIERPKGSYVSKLFEEGLARIAQKVGEEGVEVALAAVVENKQTLMNEVSDLLFHVLVLLKAREIPFKDIVSVLQQRAAPFKLS